MARQPMGSAAARFAACVEFSGNGVFRRKGDPEMDKYKVPLVDEERQQINEMFNKGKAAARKLTHASHALA